MHRCLLEWKWAGLVVSSVLLLHFSIAAQTNLSRRPLTGSVTILDSTKERDGLIGSVRRVKVQSARLELKDGRLVEGSKQLIEVTTYGLEGNRIDNVSYPVAAHPVGKEEYKYDDGGHIVEMTLRSDDGSIRSREAYAYEFDKFGNWTKMVTSVVVFEAGELRQEPVEVTYRTLTYYFDDSVASIVDAPSRRKMPVIPAYKPSPLTSLYSHGDSPSQLANLPGSSIVPFAEPVPEPKREVAVENTETTSPNLTVGEPGVAVAQSRPRVITKVAPTAPTQAAIETRSVGNNIAAGAADLPERASADKRDASAAKTAETPSRTADSEKAPFDAVAHRDALNYYRVGLERFEAGDAKEAVDAYKLSIRSEPQIAEVHLSLGQAYLKLQKDNDAAKAFKESARIDPKLVDAHYGLGLACLRLGRKRDAAEAFKRATRLSPDLAKAHYGLALAYQELQRYDDVVKEYRLLQELDRDLARKLAESFPEFILPCHAPPYCK